MDNKARRSSWTPAEDSIICDLHHEFGSRWPTIAKYLPGRSEQAIKNRWYTVLKNRPGTKNSYSDAANLSAQMSPTMFSIMRELASTEFLTTDSMSTSDMDLMLHSELIDSEMSHGCSESGFGDLSSMCVTSDAAMSLQEHVSRQTRSSSACVVPELTPIDTSSILNYTMPLTEMDMGQNKFSEKQVSRGAGKRKKSSATTPRILRSRRAQNHQQSLATAAKWDILDIAEDVFALAAQPNKTFFSSASQSTLSQGQAVTSIMTSGCSNTNVKVSPIHDLPFSPSQFLNSPVMTGGGLVHSDALTSTPLAKVATSAATAGSHHTSHTLVDGCHTPRITCHTPNHIRGTFTLPQTPTPIKNVLLEFEGKRSSECRSFRVDTSGRLVEDVDEIIRRDTSRTYSRRCPRKLNTNVKRNCSDTTPVTMATRSHHGLTGIKCRSSSNEQFKARMQISFDEVDAKPQVAATELVSSNSAASGGGRGWSRSMVCGRTDDQCEMTQLARHWLRSYKVEAIAF